ncbi:TetR/AcrR family transcriptional regulator C-terminal domain-containing protein [Glycomyces terrestris]|uniref:TetR family transcriptional regulator n=1 Tax=Glycomyces terrestris TaxID=2493553 RepID=A0A426V4I4_9ACTN|nr:TetR/AcrR family transcriptional regulator C-terminal domain-containing protein [Glycomyces terrestris]RRS01730.1 TetR family transcriptional regulator [Glycomyces terrestris]
MTEDRPPLTRERIIEAAFAIVDEAGVDRLTMRMLGERLGVDPMAVYHHLPNKAAVLDGIVEHLWGGVELPAPSDGESWQFVIGEVFRAFRRRLLAHPRAAPVVGTRPAVSPAMLALVEGILARLHRAGFAGRDAMVLIDCLAGYTIGKVLAETSAALGDEATGPVAAALATVTPQTHPFLVREIAGGYALAPDDQFERGLAALIGGWSD